MNKQDTGCCGSAPLKMLGRKASVRKTLVRKTLLRTAVAVSQAALTAEVKAVVQAT